MMHQDLGTSQSEDALVRESRLHAEESRIKEEAARFYCGNQSLSKQLDPTQVGEVMELTGVSAIEAICALDENQGDVIESAMALDDIREIVSISLVTREKALDALNASSGDIISALQVLGISPGEVLAVLEARDPPDCPICLSCMISDDDTGTLTCGHRFHTRCTDTWLARSPTCPLCREVQSGYEGDDSDSVYSDDS
ncbi:unnamed protein product, partial [marine sediment metagenome]